MLCPATREFIGWSHVKGAMSGDAVSTAALKKQGRAVCAHQGERGMSCLGMIGWFGDQVASKTVQLQHEEHPGFRRVTQNRAECVAHRTKRFVISSNFECMKNENVLLGERGSENKSLRNGNHCVGGGGCWETRVCTGAKTWSQMARGPTN